MGSTGQGYGGGGTLSKKPFDNFAFNAIECPPLVPSSNFALSSKNEFNASAFGLHVEPTTAQAQAALQSGPTSIGYSSYYGQPTSE